jgi:hypothetical protein
MYRVEVDFMRAMLQNVAVIIKINSEKETYCDKYYNGSTKRTKMYACLVKQERKKETENLNGRWPVMNIMKMEVYLANKGLVRLCDSSISPGDHPEVDYADERLVEEHACRCSFTMKSAEAGHSVSK